MPKVSLKLRLQPLFLGADTVVTTNRLSQYLDVCQRWKLRLEVVPVKGEDNSANHRKVMKDAYFKGIQWTRNFVSGPVDPIHNKFKFYCMICKSNVSIYSEGARELWRHNKTEGHLRKDEKWRYIHLQETDDVTRVTTHQVRGKYGYVLTPIELETESLPSLTSL